MKMYYFYSFQNLHDRLRVGLFDAGHQLACHYSVQVDTLVLAEGHQLPIRRDRDETRFAALYLVIRVLGGDYHGGILSQ